MTDASKGPIHEDAPGPLQAAGAFEGGDVAAEGAADEGGPDGTASDPADASGLPRPPEPDDALVGTGGAEPDDAPVGAGGAGEDTPPVEADRIAAEHGDPISPVPEAPPGHAGDGAPPEVEVSHEPAPTADAAVGRQPEPEDPQATDEPAPASTEPVEVPQAEGTGSSPDASAPPDASPPPEAPAATDASPPTAPAAPLAAGTQPPSPVAGAAPVLPPPPPELAEVPSDAGRIVAGRVREVRGGDVVVALDDGRVGVINGRNLGVEGDPAVVFSPGDPVEGAVLARSDPEHRVVLSRVWAQKKRAWESVIEAAAENRLLTGKVVSVGQKGVVVDVGVRGFVPASHLELGPVKDLKAYVDAELTLRVLDVDAERERLVLSRRSLLLKEQRRSVHDALAGIAAGEVRRGRVTSLSDYGAFVDLGGVNGLVHLSELAWHRVKHPSEVVSVGDEVDVKVLDVKVKRRRVSLSIRQLTDDPLSALIPGEIRTGPVTRLVDFGAFVELSGVEGLVHVSELAEYRVSAPEEIVAPGEEVRVKVLSVDRKRRRVELSIRQAAEFGS